MTSRAITSFSLTALMLGGSVAGCAGGGSHVASAGDAAPGQAALAAGRAGEALARGRADDAVRSAEQAVAAQPREASYRVLLGQSYLKAGRFTSARQALADALQLDPDNGKAALNLALAQIGLGDWATARATLDSHAGIIPAADRGLATALAGDPAGAVELLTAAARSPDATVKTRQNLALALALAGHWPEARAVAAVDLSPAALDQRMTQWASFAHPAGAADQVAAMLGVVPIVDAGQPVALALAAPVPVQAVPVKVADAELAPAAPQAADEPVASATVAHVPAVAMVQPLPAEGRTRPDRASAPAPVRATTSHAAGHMTAASGAGGSWFVQIGAFRNAAVARDGWARAVRRDAALRSHAPEGIGFKARFGQVYRLSVGGFARSEANALCRSYRSLGGACFVRAGAGDQVATWARKDVQLASR